jgi:hypothetical protein
MVANAAIVPDIKSAESLLADTQIRIASLFDRIIGPVS